MSLVSWALWIQDDHMNYENNVTTKPVAGFSPEHFRRAMGPGYQVATFTEQQILSEPGLPVPSHLTATAKVPSKSLSLLGLVVQTLNRARVGSQSNLRVRWGQLPTSGVGSQS